MIKRLAYKILPLFTILSMQANAIDLDENFGEHLKLNGFATVGASTVFDKGQEFKAYTFQREGVREGEVSVLDNSLLGLQAEFLLTESLSATVQGLLVNNDKEGQNATLDWAYLSYDFDSDLKLRVGKFRLPLFKSSELTYVGYARTSVRPELAVYGVGGFSNYTGADLLYNTSIGSTNLNFQLGYGTSKEDVHLQNGGLRKFETENAFIAKVTAEEEIGLLSLTYFRANSDFFFRDAKGRVVNDEVTLVQMLSAEAEINYNGFTFEFGLGKGDVDIIQPDEFLRYGTLYYQMDDWRPYASYSYKRFEEKPLSERRAQPITNPDPNRQPPPGPARERYEEIIGIGVRYDFIDNAALKIQLDHVNGMQSTPQLLISDDQQDRKATVFTITVDMVF